MLQEKWGLEISYSKPHQKTKLADYPTLLMSLPKGSTDEVHKPFLNMLKRRAETQSAKDREAIEIKKLKQLDPPNKLDDSIKLEGKTIIITGGNTGVG
jgi:hypothetical protein